MEIFVETGRGYSPVEERGKEKAELGVIAIDALFTPVRDVGVRVENVRVGQITNFDKLIMEIETDGTVTPEDAVQQSIKILLDHFSLFLPASSMAASEEVVEEVVAPVEEVDEAEEDTKPAKKAKKKK